MLSIWTTLESCCMVELKNNKCMVLDKHNKSKQDNIMQISVIDSRDQDESGHFLLKSHALTHSHTMTPFDDPGKHTF